MGADKSKKQSEKEIKQDEKNHEQKSSWIEKINKLFKELGDIKELGADKLKEVVNDFGEILPIVEKAGYKIHEFQIVLALPPAFITNFIKTKDIPEKDIKNIIEANSDKKLLKIILKSLIKANQFQGEININKMKFTEVTVELTVPPKVVIKFK
jgi:hypothetical protein